MQISVLLFLINDNSGNSRLTFVGKLPLPNVRRKPSGRIMEMPGQQAPGETLPECLKRELHEELGIEVAVHELP